MFGNMAHHLCLHIHHKQICQVKTGSVTTLINEAQLRLYCLAPVGQLSCYSNVSPSLSILFHNKRMSIFRDSTVEFY